MTTIKRYLDDWKAHQQTARPPAIDLPDEVVAKGTEFTRLLSLGSASSAARTLPNARRIASTRCGPISGNPSIR